MSAPRVTEDWRQALRALKAGWNEGGSEQIDERAIETVAAIHFVPTNAGGIQIEMHAGGVDWEMEIEPDGTVRSCYWEKAGRTA